MEKVCLWNLESWALESEIQLKESGIPITVGIQIKVPYSEKQYLECGSKAWNPESKTVLQGANYVNKSHARLLLVDKKNVTDILNFIKILIFFFSFHVVLPKTATSAEIMYVTFFQS